MRTTGIFTTHHYEIPFKKYNEPIYLIPFGDVHRSATLCDEKKWFEFLAWAKKKERCYFLGMGDYDDLMSTGERRILQDPKLHDTTRQTHEQMYERFTDRFAKEIGFMKDKLIGLIEGNHYATFSDGTTTTQRLCYKLNCKYLGVTSFIVLSLRYDKFHSHKVILWVHHGVGGGRTVGGSITRVEQMEKVAEADIYLMGHDHRKSVSFLSKFHLREHARDRMRVCKKTILLARTGTFLRGYVDKQPSYIADTGLSLTDLGVIKIELTPKREERSIDGINYDDREVSIHASI